MIRDLLRVEHGLNLNRGKVGRLMKLMRIEAIYRQPRTSLLGKGEEHKIYPCLLGERGIEAPDEAGCADLTYLPMGRGFARLLRFNRGPGRAANH